MPNYTQIDNLVNHNLVIDNLLKLREKLKEIPPKTFKETLLLATWNIREFGLIEKRLDENYYYMAEIISRFDLVAIQEVGSDLSSLQMLISRLGYQWDYLVADPPNVEGGNERIAYVYNTGKIKFLNECGEIRLDKKEREEFDLQETDIARPPYIAYFQANWFKFYLCSVHIYYGDKNNPRRENEIKAITNKISKLAEKYESTYIMLGDFNIEKVGDPFYNALVGTEENPTGFKIFEAITNEIKINKEKEGFDYGDSEENLLDEMDVENSNGESDDRKQLNSNANGDHPFDQIAINYKSKIRYAEDPTNKIKNMGVFNFFDVLYNKENDLIYKNEDIWSNHISLSKKDKIKIPKDDKDLKNWKTFQMSDHFPLWVELPIDFSENYLIDKKK